MSKLEALREAIVKIDEAEAALFLLKQIYRKSNDTDFDEIEKQFELVGDASSSLTELLGKLEQIKLQEMPK